MAEKLDWGGLPEHFKRDVIKCLGFSNRCSLRECSSADKDLVDSCPIVIEYIRLKKDDQTNGKIEFIVSDPPKIFKRLSADAESVIKDFLRIVSHPKSEIGEIFTYFPYSNLFNSKFFAVLSRELQNLKPSFKIRTNHFFWACFVGNESHMLEFIQRLDPNCLKRLYLDTCPTRKTMKMLINTEQWKDLTEFSVAVYQDFFTNLTVEINELLHFDILRIAQKNTRTEEVLTVVQNFRTKPRPLNSFFSLESKDPLDTEEMLDMLGLSDYFHKYDNSRVFSVQNTENVLLVSVDDWFVTGIIQRKNRVSEDVTPRFTNWSEHIKRLGEGMPW